MSWSDWSSQAVLYEGVQHSHTFYDPMGLFAPQRLAVQRALPAVRIILIVSLNSTTKHLCIDGPLKRLYGSRFQLHHLGAARHGVIPDHRGPFQAERRWNLRCRGGGDPAGQAFLCPDVQLAHVQVPISPTFTTPQSIIITLMCVISHWVSAVVPPIARST